MISKIIWFVPNLIGFLFMHACKFFSDSVSTYLYFKKWYKCCRKCADHHWEFRRRCAEIVNDPIMQKILEGPVAGKYKKAKAYGLEEQQRIAREMNII